MKPIHACAPAMMFGEELPCPVCAVYPRYVLHLGSPVDYQHIKGLDVPVHVVALLKRELHVLVDRWDVRRAYGHWKVESLKAQRAETEASVCATAERAGTGDG